MILKLLLPGQERQLPARQTHMPRRQADAHGPPEALIPTQLLPVLTLGSVLTTRETAS